MIKAMILSATALLTVGCLHMPDYMAKSMPGAISTHTSEFDGMTELYMEPAFTYNSQLRLGLRKNSEMAKGDFVLSVMTLSAERMSQDQALLIRVDNNQIITPRAIDNIGEISVHPILDQLMTTRRYAIRRADLNRIINADNPFARYQFDDGSLLEGALRAPASAPINKNAPPIAAEAFKKFIEEWDALVQK